MSAIKLLFILFRFHNSVGFLVDVGIVKVLTPVGEIAGKLHNVQFDGNQYQIKEFLGIPFAEPPIGERRWRKPVPKAAFNSTFNAFDFAPACLQGPNPVATAAVKIPKSEDCLYLNVFAPVLAGSPNRTLPVMIFIHGGGFTGDSTHLYVADVLSAYGEVIVAVVSYRLTYLGFLQTNERNGGNFGLWDQHLAIKWVHDNIASFGGDIGNVTIFGESAGSTSVIYQSLYPGNKGLFQRGIAESGSITSSWGFSYNITAHNTFTKFSSTFGCSGSASETMKCLRNVSSDKIQNLLMTENTNFLVLPFLDGEFIKATPIEMFKPVSQMSVAHDFFRGIDLLIGGNSIDGALLMGIWTKMLGQPDPEYLTIPRQLYESLFIPLTLQGYYTYIPNIPQSVKDATIFEYTDWAQPNDNVARNLQLTEMATDYAVFSPMIYTAQGHLGNSTASTFLYKFSTRPNTHLLPTPSWLDGPTRANHADELAFVFGFSERRNVQYQNFGVKFNVSAQDVRVSKSVMTMWTNFAKSG